MAAFQLAVEQGADLVELDVQQTADGFLVVIHDFAVDRTTDGQGLVKDLTLDAVRQLNASARFPGGFSPQQVPTLDEVLEWAKGRVPVAIEVKSGPVHYQGIEGRVLAAVESHGATSSVVVISFDHGMLLRLKRMRPEIATGVLYAGAPVDASMLAMVAHAEALLPHWTDVTPSMVEQAHGNGIAVSTWAVDEERDMSSMVSMGVDAVATNYPKRLVGLLKGREREQGGQDSRKWAE